MAQLRSMLVLLVASFAATSHAQTQTQTPTQTQTQTQTSPASTKACQVAVLDLEGQGLTAQQQHLTTALTEALASSVAEASGCEVITRADIESMMGFEAARMACGVDADSCIAEIGNALGVQRIVAGSIAHVGDATTVSARLLNMELGRVEARANETTEREGALRGAAIRVGARLFGKGAPSSSGPSALAIAGGVVGSVGVVAAAIGGVLVYGAEQTLAAAPTNGDVKERSQQSGTVGLIVGGVGAAAVIGGVAMLVLGTVGE